MSIVRIRGLIKIVSCLLFVHCSTTLSLVIWGFVIVAVAIAIYANRSA